MSILRFVSLLLPLLFGNPVLATSLAQVDLAPPVLPRPAASEFVMARDGHFFLGDQRVRFWGFNLQSGVFPTYSEITHLAERLFRLGVNAVRLWPTQGTFYDARSLPERNFAKSGKGDGSLLDRYDFLVAELKRNGIFIQNPSLHYVDLGAIRYWPDPETRAILEPKASDGDIRRLHGIAPYLSRAWEAMLATHIRNYLGHVNPYTGLAYANEPVFSGWELANESQFIYCALRAACITTLPDALRTSLEDLWQDYWLRTSGGANRVLPVLDHDWDRSDSAAHMAYRSFVLERFVEVSRRLEDVARGMAPAGVGIAVQPITYSTQAGDPLLVARAAYSAGDYSSIGAYQTPLVDDEASPYFPYRLNLSQPFFYNFNYGGVAGKPTVVYEHSFFRPYPYRAEWPWAMLYLAATQDWDGLFLYTYGQPWAIYGTDKEGRPIYGEKPLPTPSDPVDGAPKGVYSGLHQGGDEVIVSAWSAAGLVFLSGTPTIRMASSSYVFHPAQVFGPAPGYCDSSRGCGKGSKQIMSKLNLASLAGPIRLVFSQGGNLPVTASPRRASKKGAASSSNMDLSPKLPRLLIDTASSKAVAGVLEGDVLFADGFGIHFPRRQFGFVSLTATDGLPLQASRNIRVQSSGKSANTGFVFNPRGVDTKRATGVVQGVRSPGRSPVVFERPAYALTLPMKFTRFDRFDFNLKAYEFNSPDLAVRANEPFFMGVISR